MSEAEVYDYITHMWVVREHSLHNALPNTIMLQKFLSWLNSIIQIILFLKEKKLFSHQNRADREPSLPNWQQNLNL